MSKRKIHTNFRVISKVVWYDYFIRNGTRNYMVKLRVSGGVVAEAKVTVFGMGEKRVRRIRHDISGKGSRGPYYIMLVQQVMKIHQRKMDREAIPDSNRAPGTPEFMAEEFA